jgi:type I restriction enzyme M protein
MLDSDTRRRIDTARDILVGKVPDPKSQVEQITIALIYKFMDDMDAESEEMGGKRKFFADEFARYGWAKLMRSGLGGYEILNMYAEAITKMPENPGIPLLFRDIFKNAYLPYRDPETLKAFLKIIDEFEYDHSERLGDAFEYLLSILGSQGEAGQFRTPRHIIDFMVEIVDPKKNETVLDPACGTAGFLISSYKHILKANKDEDGNSTLTPDERGRLARNFTGYDISPDMVRLSLVNMYLHGFVDPHIYEYDTLTSLDRWNEYADVILANPPFMSPKGGIKPHTRFSVQSKRSEVLFVDYMAEHLTPTGRAGIIVPEGVIFQNGTAYVQLRKMLVEEYLVAVISLPGGVFNPYSGVKTSILILDKSLAKKSKHIGFFKIESDGFDLGAQRRPIEKNELPPAEKEISQYLDKLRRGDSVSDLQTNFGLIVTKEKLSANGEHNLSAERYRENGKIKTTYDWVELGSITLGNPQYGSGASKVPFDGKIRYIRITDLTDQGTLKLEDPVSPSIIEQEHFLEPGDLLIARSGSVGRTYLHNNPNGIFQFAGYLIRFQIDPTKALPLFVFHMTQSKFWKAWIVTNSKTGTLTNINAKQYSSFTFPLPPLDVQREIVEEIEEYQKVIDGARAVVDNYRPHIPINPEWPKVKLGEILRTSSGGTPLRGRADYYENGTIPWVKSGEVGKSLITSTEERITEAGLKNSSAKIFPKDTVLVAMYGATAGQVGRLGIDAATNQAVCGILPDPIIIPDFLYYHLKSRTKELVAISTGGAQPNISQSIIRELKIPLPPLAIQQAIVSEIDADQAIITANRELIIRYEKKIQTTLARVWGEEKPTEAKG